MNEPFDLDMTGAEFCAMATHDRLQAEKVRKIKKRLKSVTENFKTVAFLLFIFSLIFFAGYITSPVSMKNTRIETGEVIKTQNGTITIITDDGNIWDIIDETDQYKNYNKIYAVFNTYGTDSIYDDSIDYLEQR